MHKGLVGETLDWPTGELDFHWNQQWLLGEL